MSNHNKKVMKFYYCAFESVFSPVFDSQILTFLKKVNNELKGSNESVNLILFSSLRDFLKAGYWVKRKLIRDFLNKKVLFSFKFPYLYKFPITFRFTLFLNSLMCLFVFIFVARLKKSKGVVFHCRTDIGSYILLTVKKIFYKNIKIICDCRGVYSKEVSYKSGRMDRNYFFRHIERIESYAQVNSDYLFCVSRTFKEHILKNNYNKIKKIKVIPCCIDSEKFKYDPVIRKKIRKEMNIDGKFVVVYSGSLNEWQLPLRMLEIFKIIKSVITGSIFVMFTKDLKYAREIFLNSGIKEDSYILISRPYHLINSYLQVGDLSLLMREDNIVNRVAFPVKFPEYVRCGVPVLSSITSDVINIIEDNDLGFKVNNLYDDAEIKRLALKIKENLKIIKGDKFKMRISNIIGRMTSWDIYIKPVINVYREVIND